MVAIKAALDLPRHEDPDIVVDVREELSRILSHEQFKDTTRLKRFLSYVVEEALGGRADRLKGYTIGVEVFDRPDDFDPQADTIVRVQAGQLRRRLDLYYAKEGRSSPLRILLPKGRYAPVFERRSVALPALTDNIAPQPPNSTGNMDSDSGATVTLLAGQNRPRILVPSFADMTANSSTPFFADGLTAETINALVQFRYLHIIAATAPADAGLSLTDYADLRKDMGIDFVLSGAIRYSQDLVRVSINLISTESGVHILTKSFDREATPENLFEIQEEIASYTAASVGAPFGAVNRYNRRLNDGRQTCMSGYNALLKFYDIGLDVKGEAGRALIAEFDTVLKDTPYFSSGWAAKSLLHSFFISQTVPNTGWEIHLSEAARCAHRACVIDPDNALAFHAEFVAAYHGGDFVKYERAAARALSLNPNDYNQLAHYAVTKALQGDVDTARLYHRSACALITIPPVWFRNAPVACDFLEGDYDAVIAATDDLVPGSPIGLILLRVAACGLTGQKDKISDIMAYAPKDKDTALAQAEQTLAQWYPHPEIIKALKKGWAAVF